MAAPPESLLAVAGSVSVSTASTLKRDSISRDEIPAIFNNSDWANLPKNLLDSVVERLLCSSDYLQFSLVCKKWFSVAQENQSRFKQMVCHQEPPMLLFFNAKEDAWSLYNVLDNKILDHVQLKMPNKRFCGSCKGWLIVVEEDFSVTIINPFLGSKGKIHLPQLVSPEYRASEPWRSGDKSVNPDYFESYVMKAIITADPISNSNECIVVVTDVKHTQMAFTRIGEDKWTFVDRECFIWGIDVLQHGDKLCILEANGNLYTLSITSELSYSVVNNYNCHMLPIRDKIREYLVQSHENELFLVVRLCDWDDTPEYTLNRFTLEFLVFKFDFVEQKWIKKTSLGDDVALFIGENYSVYVVASNFPGCKPNCIYYNHDDDFMHNGDSLNDFGVYDMKMKKSLKSYSTKLMSLLEMINQRPIWFTPTFYL